MTTKLLIKLNDLIKDKSVNLGYQFTSADSYKRLTVPFYSFKNIIQKFYASIPDSDLTLLYHAYKENQTGNVAGESPVNYVRFMKDIENIKKYEREILNIFERITEQMRLGKGSLYSEMEKISTVGGKVEEHNLYEVLRKLGMTLKAQESDAFMFYFKIEGTTMVDEKMIKEEYDKYLKQINTTYDKVCYSGSYKDDLQNYKCRYIFILFHKTFQRKMIVNPISFFEQHSKVDPNHNITCYEFGNVIDIVVPGVDQQDYKRLESDLLDSDTFKISLDKFVALYNSIKSTLKSNEIDAAATSQGSNLSTHKLFSEIEKSLEKKQTNLKSFFSKYNYQPSLHTISKQDFIVAFQDLGIDDRKFTLDMALDALGSRGDHLNLADLDNYITEVNQKDTFYLNHPDNQNIKTMFENLIEYTHSQSQTIDRVSGMKVTNLLIRENKAGNGLIDTNAFFNHLKYYEIYFNANDSRMIIEKYDTYQNEMINILEFCIDFESTLSTKRPNAENLLYTRGRELKPLVETLHRSILRNNSDLNAWVGALCNECKSFKISLSNLLLQLKKLDGSLTLAELYSLISNMDKFRNGFVLDFKLSEFFSNFEDVSVSEKVILRLIDVLKERNINLPQYLKGVLSIRGGIDMDKLKKELEKDGISPREFRLMLGELNLSEFALDSAELQQKIKGECVRSNIANEHLVDKFIIGRSGNAMRLRILQDLSDKMRIKRMTTQAFFGYPLQQQMPIENFRRKFGEIGLLAHRDFPELVESLLSPSDPYVVSLEKLITQMNEVEDGGPGELVSPEKLLEIKNDIKRRLTELSVSVVRLFKKIDSDNSSNISLTEFSFFIHQLDPAITKAETRALFSSIDRDRTNKITRIELESTFGITLKDEMNEKIQSLSWAANIFAEISLEFSNRMVVPRQYFENLKNSKTISLSIFKRGLNDLDLKSLQDFQTRKKFEKGFLLENENNLINFQLFLVCLDEFQDSSAEMSVYPDSTQRIFSRLLKHFDYDVQKITRHLDIDGNKSLSRQEFKIVCKNLVKGVSDSEINGAFSSISEDEKAKEIKLTSFEEKLVKFIEDQKNRETFKIRQYLGEKKPEFLRECDRSDPSRLDYLTSTQFKHVLSTIGYNYTIEEINALRAGYPEEFRSDRIYYSKFIAKVCENLKDLSFGITSRVQSGAIDFKEVCERIKRRMNFSATNLAEEFSILDRDNDKMIPMTIILEAIGYIADTGNLTSHIEEAFVKKLRCLKSRDVNYLRVVSLVFNGHTNPQYQAEASNKAILEDFINQIRIEMNASNMTSSSLFELYDHDGDGVVGFDEFSEAVQRRMITYTSNEIKELYDSLKSKSKNGFLNIISFKAIIFGYMAKDVRPFIFKLKALLSAKNMTSADLFNYMDRQKDKIILFDEFKAGVRSIDSQMGVFEADLLFSHFDKDGDGKINLREFVLQLDDESFSSEFQKELDIYIRRNRTSLFEVFNKYADNLTIDRGAFLRFGTEVTQGLFNDRKLHKVFEELDVDNSGSLDIDELNYLFDPNTIGETMREFNRFKIIVLDELMQRQMPLTQFFEQYAGGKGLPWRRAQLRTCLQALREEMTDKNEEDLFNILDTDRKSEVSLINFKRKILGPRPNLVEQIKTLRRVVRLQGIDIKKKIQQIDIDKDRTIEFSEFMRFVSLLNLNLTYPEISYLFEEIDANGNGQIHYDEMREIFEKPLSEIENANNFMITLKSELEMRSAEIEDEFNKNANSSHKLNSIGFTNMLKNLKIKLNRFETQQAFRSLDYEHQGLLSYSTIVDFIGNESQGGERFGDIKIIKQTLLELRQEITSKGKDAEELFGSLDLDKEGVISTKNFNLVLTTSRLLHDEPQKIILLSRYFRVGVSSQVDYKKLIVMMEQVRGVKPKLADELSIKIDQEIHIRNCSLIDFFKSFDTKREDQLDLAQFTRMVRSLGFHDERSTTLSGTFDYITQSGSIKKERINYIDFLRLFSDERAAEESRNFLKDFSAIIDKLKATLKQKGTTLKNLMGLGFTKNSFIMKVSDLWELSPTELSELRQFAARFSGLTYGQDIDAQGIIKIIDSSAEDEQRVTQDNTFKGKGILKNMIDNGKLNGFSKERIDEMKTIINTMNGFIEEDEMKWEEFFQQKDPAKTGKVSFTDFE